MKVLSNGYIGLFYDFRYRQSLILYVINRDLMIAVFGNENSYNHKQFFRTQMDTWEVFFLIIFAVLIYCLFSGKGSSVLTGGRKRVFNLFGKGYDGDIAVIKSGIDGLIDTN